MANVEPPSSKIVPVLKILDTTTKLLGLAILVAQGILLFLANRLDGLAQILLVVGTLVLLLIAVTGGIYLEAKRISSNRTAAPLKPSENPQIAFKYTSVSSKPNSLFLSAPMDAFDNAETQVEHREVVLQIQDSLRKHCGIEYTYYAGTDIQNGEEFQSPAVALRQNFQKLCEAEKFIMIYPERLASSILFEAGMALGLRKDSVWFAKEGKKLPFLMRRAEGASEKGGLPKIQIYYYDSPRKILNWIENDGNLLF